MLRGARAREADADRPTLTERALLADAAEAPRHDSLVTAAGEEGKLPLGGNRT